MGKPDAGANQPGRKRGDGQPEIAHDPSVRKPSAPKPVKPETRGLFDTTETGYQLASRSEQFYPEAYRPLNEEFWRGVNPEQADALVKLQAIAMEKVGFEKGTPKFFIDDDPGSAYAADEYFIGTERASVPSTARSSIGMTDAEIAYTAAREEKARWLKARKDKRRRAIQRESESDGGMNFLPSTRAELLEAEELITSMARQGAVPELDGPALLTGGMLIGAGLVFAYLGILPVFVEEYASIIAKALPIAGLCCSGFGVVVLFNHMRS